MKSLRNFFYGREDVALGKRGYRVFNSNTILPEKISTAIENCFTDRDPDPYTNQQLNDFIVYFQVPSSSEWLLGRGIIEDRERYSSYIIHCVLLDEEERKQSLYNPFYILPQLKPQIGDNRTTNQTVYLKKINELDLVNDLIKNFGDRFTLSLSIGEFFSHLIESSTIVIPLLKSHLLKKKYISENYWFFLFFFFQLKLRYTLSITTFDKILDERLIDNVDIIGVIDHYSNINKRRDVLVDDPKETVFGNWLDRLLRFTEEDQIKDKIYYYYTAVINYQGLLSKNDIENCIIKPVESESVESLSKWSPNRQDLLNWRVKHYINVWKRNKNDMNPDELITKSFINQTNELLKEISVISEKEKKKYYSHMDENVIQELFELLPGEAESINIKQYLNYFQMPNIFNDQLEIDRYIDIIAGGKYPLLRPKKNEHIDELMKLQSGIYQLLHVENLLKNLSPQNFEYLLNRLTLPEYKKSLAEKTIIFLYDIFLYDKSQVKREEYIKIFVKTKNIKIFLDQILDKVCIDDSNVFFHIYFDFFNFCKKNQDQDLFKIYQNAFLKNIDDRKVAFFWENLSKFEPQNKNDYNDYIEFVKYHKKLNKENSKKSVISKKRQPTIDTIVKQLSYCY